MIFSAGIMSLATALSRLLGFVRDWLIAVFYGTSPTAQAFVVAFRVPNLFRDLVGEGAANAAFVPVFSRIRSREGAAVWAALAQAVWARLLIGFVVICAAGFLLSPWIARAVAPGFRSDPALMEQTVRLMRILFPFLGLVGVAAFFMGLLNSIHHFALPSLGPVLLNLCMIAGLLLYRPDAIGLAWGVIAGGLLQIAVQVPLLRRHGISLRWVWKNHPGVREIRQLLVPRAIGSAVYQGSVLVDTLFASFGQWVGAGGVASLYFANRFLHLPLALFGVSMAQAALPTLSHHAAREDQKAIRSTLLTALHSSLLVAIPSAVGLIVLGRPIIATLLQQGAFSPEATQMTVSALQFYALGLASFCAVKVFVNVLYAFHDTWTPVRSAAVSLALNLVLNALLIFPMKLAGLALATSLSSFWNSWSLYTAVRGRIGPMDRELVPWLGRVILASLGMGGVAWGIWSVGASFEPTRVGQLLWLAGSILGGLGVLAGLGLLLRIEEIHRVRTWIWRRK